MYVYVKTPDSEQSQLTSFRTDMSNLPVVGDSIKLYNGDICMVKSREWSTGSSSMNLILHCVTYKYAE